MPILGVIADDFTGATDVANMLVRGGLRTVQCFGIPKPDSAFGDVDAIVVALKSRSIPAPEAVSISLRALKWLRGLRIERFLFKYCSTFDSTDRGNIGPVAEALMRELGCPQTIFCPAFPENSRTVYAGHLFVGDKPLDESGMEHHPLNPMTDANLVRLLEKQTRSRVGLLPYRILQQGTAAIQRALEQLLSSEVTLVVTDALDDQHLHGIAAAVCDWPLVTGGSGIALGLADAYRRLGWVNAQSQVAHLPSAIGRAAVLSGSCSRATQLQVAYGRQFMPSYAIDVPGLVAGQDIISAALQWADKQLSIGPILIYSTANPEDFSQLQGAVGPECAAQAVEKAFAAIARGLVDLGVRRLVVAGGETAGAVIQALGVQAIRIGPQISPGVPWTETLDEQALALALKSGNFGKDDFFTAALEMLP